MQIKIDKDHYITGFAVIGGIEGGIDVPEAKVPADFLDDFYARKWKYEKGAFSLSGEERPEPDAGPEIAPDPLLQRLDEIEAGMCELADMIVGGGL